MKNKLKNIFNLTQVSHEDHRKALSNGVDIHKERLDAIKELVNEDDKLFKAITEISNIAENKNMPFCEIFAQSKLHKAIEIANTALGNPIDYSKQPNLDLK